MTEHHGKPTSTRGSLKLQSPQFPSEKLLVHKHDGVQCCLLSVDRDLAFVGQIAEPGVHVLRRQGFRVLATMKANEVAYPEAIGFLGTIGQVACADKRTEAVHEACRLGWQWLGYIFHWSSLLRAIWMYGIKRHGTLFNGEKWSSGLLFPGPPEAQEISLLRPGLTEAAPNGDIGHVDRFEVSTRDGEARETLTGRGLQLRFNEN